MNSGISHRFQSKDSRGKGPPYPDVEVITDTQPQGRCIALIEGREGRYVYAYPRPMLTVDIVVLAGPAENPAVLLIKRRTEPFAGQWALPGGYLEENETPALGAARELREETGLAGLDLRLFGVFGQAGRDPRGWTVSLAYRTRLPAEAAAIRAGDDAADAGWFPVDTLPPLAFDHGKIVREAIEGGLIFSEE